MSRRIGPYAVLGELGSGAMGRVFLGRSAAGRLVAIKTIRADLGDDPDFRARFRHEVAAARKVAGAFTAPVVAADADAETPWLATVYLPIPTLRRLVRAVGPLPVAAVQWLAAGCAEALESIHAVGLIHRDLKPSNVLVSLDGPRVIDFGVAKAAERGALTLGSQPIGTPSYMSPEQALGTRAITPAADVFALGSTLVYAATGHAPQRGEDVLARQPASPPDLDGLPAELVEMITACLSRDPAKRPTPAQLLAEFAPFTEGESGDRLGRLLLPEAAVAVIESAQDPDEETFTSLPSDPGRSGEIRTVPGRVRLGWGTGAMLGAGAAGLLAVGGMTGALLADEEPAKQQPPQQATAPNPVGLPPPPPSGEEAKPDGRPKVVVNQPMGDKNTVFVLHGTGWRPGERISVRIGGRTARTRPAVDRKGTFNYAVNQNHEFWRGALPEGNHIVTVTGKAGHRSTTFVVHP
ncbi:serine/threonine-protein kinase [Actinocorallia longicatena]|uniref:Protein kinase domain-containing protein n=1 Tax=Actinocorallia longicatena TaxID=111803 RepID=A0ABP6Q8F1_9ACTN